MSALSLSTRGIVITHLTGHDLREHPLLGSREARRHLMSHLFRGCRLSICSLPFAFSHGASGFLIWLDPQKSSALPAMHNDSAPVQWQHCGNAAQSYTWEAETLSAAGDRRFANPRSRRSWSVATRKQSSSRIWRCSRFHTTWCSDCRWGNCFRSSQRSLCHGIGGCVGGKARCFGRSTRQSFSIGTCIRV